MGQQHEEVKKGEPYHLQGSANKNMQFHFVSKVTSYVNEWYCTLFGIYG